MKNIKKKDEWHPVLPHRALYICDGKCEPKCKGCHHSENGINWTEDECHAKNGPVVNVREWETRFELKYYGTLWYYQEKRE